MPALSLTLKSLLLALATLAPATSAAPMDSDLAPRSSYLQSYLFPIGGYNSGSSFTTSTSLSPRFTVDSALIISNGNKPANTYAPEGHSAMQAYFPAGSINPGNANAPKGGFSWYSAGPSYNTAATSGGNNWHGDLTKATEVTFGYSVYFQQGFEWALGGKLPGLYGGTTDALAVSCSGGRQEDRDDCFSIRMMWRTDGAGEAYNYLPTSVTQPASYANAAPKTVLNAAYGDSVGRGSFYFAGGAWTTVSQRIKLNDIGAQNGELQIFVNGVSKINLSGLTLRTKSATVFRGIQAQTFFGGHTTEYASPQDQSAWFKDWSVAIIY